MTTQTNRDEMLASLRAFVRQRPGFEPANYGSAASYRADVRRAGRDLRDAEELLRAVTWRTSCTLAENKCGRLSWNGKGWEYVAGQYFPTEYRAAACAFLASALWRCYSVGLPERKTVKGPDGQTEETYAGMSAGDWIRRQARIDLGPRLARRWFS